jgi:gluconokinase
MVILVMGVSGSGKTTVGRRLAERLGWVFHDADDDHPRANVEKMARGEPLTENDRRPWLETLRARVSQWVDNGEDAVLACSALTEQSRQILDVVTPAGTLVHLKGSKDVIARRMEQRENHFFSSDLLDSQLNALEPPSDAIDIDIDIEAEPDQIVETIVKSLR